MNTTSPKTQLLDSRFFGLGLYVSNPNPRKIIYESYMSHRSTLYGLPSFAPVKLK